MENENKTKKFDYNKKHSVGKFFYLSVIFNSFIKDPQNIFRYLMNVFQELKFRIRKNKIKK